jgi:acyl dehydratase
VSNVGVGAYPTCPFEVGEGFIQTLGFDADSIPVVAELIGDTNPLHHHAAWAATTRFGGLIASGGHSTAAMLAPTAAFMNTRCNSLGLEFWFRLRRAVRADSVMTLEWRIARITAKPSLKGHLIDMTGTLREPDGALAIEATCTALALWPEALV